MSTAFWAEAPERFFDAWREGVALAGFRYFGDGTEQGFLSAKDKGQLRPSISLIRRDFELLSPGEAKFLALMVSFYNGAVGAELCAASGFRALDDVGGLDLGRRRVVAALLLNYTGW